VGIEASDGPARNCDAARSMHSVAQRPRPAQHARRHAMTVASCATSRAGACRRTTRRMRRTTRRAGACGASRPSRSTSTRSQPPPPLCTGNKVAVQSTRPHRGNNNNNNKKVTRRGPAGPRRQDGGRRRGALAAHPQAADAGVALHHALRPGPHGTGPPPSVQSGRATLPRPVRTGRATLSAPSPRKLMRARRSARAASSGLGSTSWLTKTST